MPEILHIDKFLSRSERLPVADVRSPAEYLRGHLPGAFSMPLFSDEERAVVGTLYTRHSRAESVKAGLRFVGPRMTWFVEEAERFAPEKNILVYCWRGGMRSAAVGFLLELAGFRVSLLSGGYRAYRRKVHEAFQQDLRLVVLGGRTGSGKTGILKALGERGNQVIDLEGLANHKGSVFGHIGEAPQPTTEQFENLLFGRWRALDLSRPVWVEDESMDIGKVKIPVPLFQKILSAPLIRIEVPLEMRIARLVSEYATVKTEFLASAFNKIAKRLGGQNLKEALAALDQGDYARAAAISLRYYDEAYDYAVSKRDPALVTDLQLSGVAPELYAEKVEEGFRIPG